MNILFVTEDHSIRNYGITSVVSQLANELVHHDPNVRIVIVTTAGEPVAQDESIPIETIQPSLLWASWRWKSTLKEELNSIIQRYEIDIIHIHGVWMAIQLIALSIAKQPGVPCLISAHGMLEPWLWSEQNLFKKQKKELYFSGLFKTTITESSFFHAITPTEKENLQKLLPAQRIVVIPNAINVNEEKTYEDTGRGIAPEKTILFLGRLHPKKGVDLLVNAFCRANLTSEWRLLLVGPESVHQYVNKIKADVSNMGLSDRVEFTGPIYGEKKQELIRKSWVMITPSYSEVVGMVNLEAAACKVPSITTYETGLWDWEEGGGMLVHPKVDEITNALVEASQWSIVERLSRGEKSQKLVQEKYSWNAVIPQWLKIYSEITTVGVLNE